MSFGLLRFSWLATTLLAGSTAVLPNQGCQREAAHAHQGGQQQYAKSRLLASQNNRGGILSVLFTTTDCLITSLYNFGCIIYRLDLNMIGIFTSFVGKY